TRFGLLSPKLTPKRCRTAREQQLRIDRIGSGGPFWSIPPARIRAQASHSFLENGFKRMRQRSVPYARAPPHKPISALQQAERRTRPKKLKPNAMSCRLR